jgi:hypothetical protein
VNPICLCKRLERSRSVKQNPSLPENLKAGYAAILPYSTRIVIICTLDKKTRGPSVDPNKQAVMPYEPPKPVPNLDINRIAYLAFKKERVPTLVSLLVPAICPDYNVYSSTIAALIVSCINARVITLPLSKQCDRCRTLGDPYCLHSLATDEIHPRLNHLEPFTHFLNKHKHI